MSAATPRAGSYLVGQTVELRMDSKLVLGPHELVWADVIQATVTWSNNNKHARPPANFVLLAVRRCRQCPDAYKLGVTDVEISMPRAIL